MSKQGSNSELFAHENNALTARPQIKTIQLKRKEKHVCSLVEHKEFKGVFFINQDVFLQQIKYGRFPFHFLIEVVFTKNDAKHKNSVVFGKKDICFLSFSTVIVI